MHFLIFNQQRLIRLKIAGKRTDSIEELRSRVYALMRNSLSDKREYARRHRKRGVNAQPPAARQERECGGGGRDAAKAGQGPRLRHRRRLPLTRGIPTLRATATCRRHLLCGNPSTWPKQSYGVCSNIKVDNVHNPTWLGAIQRMQTHARVRAWVWPRISRYKYGVSLRAGTLSCDDRRCSSNWRKSSKR